MDLKILIAAEQGHVEWERVREHLAKRKGVALFGARSSGEAFSLLKSEDINIVLADYAMPRMNPLKFLDKLKSLAPHVEVIFLSAQSPLSRGIEAMKAGAYDFYEFPVNMRLLMAVIEKAVEKQKLYIQKEALELKMKETYGFDNIIGASKPLQHVKALIRSVAPRNVNVLITGETGTGKELVANAIHQHSPRSSQPFISVNCAAFNEGVLESELFGHERGSFTGAVSRRVGRFELAHQGTLFMDEIGDLTPGTQVTLLRVLQEQRFERVGGNETIKVDVRIIAATNRNLRAMVEAGRFREDLFYRLNVVTIDMPSLRERKSDIPLLVNHFIAKLDTEKGYQIRGISREAMRLMMDYNWPGNVRELFNAVESSMALTSKDMIEAQYLPSFMLLAAHKDSDYYMFPKELTLDEVENEMIRLALERTGGNKTHAARALGIGLRTLQRKLAGSNA